MNQTLRQAINHYGTDAQTLQAIEECAELVQALLHFRRGKANRQDVVGEIADVLIMAGQLRLMFGHEQVDQAMEGKLERLRERMGVA